MPYYLDPVRVGLEAVSNLGDGTSFNISWYEAHPSNTNNKIAYHIYYATEKENVFREGVKYISISSDLNVNIIDMDPGQEYWFSVRPVEYSNTINLNNLPDAYDNLKYYPTTILRSSINENDLIIPVLDIYGFNNLDIIKIGSELIEISYIDSINNNFILNNISQRGILSIPRMHDISGFDGIHTYSPTITLFTPGEDNRFDRIYASQARFEYPNFAYTLLDGYKQVVKDLLSTDLSIADETNTGFPGYDYSGWHRTDPKLILQGVCVGSYIGGERGCIDGYGNFNRVRGLNAQDQINQREEQQLEVLGRVAVLLKRAMTGNRCSCFLPNSEYPDDRCPFCNGTGFLTRYEQFFNQRRSDGRILVRSDPTDETIKMQEAGLESEYPLKLWTLAAPTIKSRDIIILFDEAGNEEFRYEVLSVTRNSTFFGMTGAQKLNCARIRKFDPAYQTNAFDNTSTMPEWINTSIASAIPAVMPHTHKLRRNENDPSTWEQNTQIAQGHVHEIKIINGQLTIMETMGHSHELGT